MGDAGLPAERTALAWQRTALGIGAVGALMLRDTEELAPRWPGLLGLALAMAVLVTATVRHHDVVDRLTEGREVSRPTLLLALTIGLGLLAVVAIAQGAWAWSRS